MSRGTDRIVIEGREVYAAFERLGGVLRCRLSADDWEAWGLVGARVEVRYPDLSCESFFIRSSTFTDPGWQWIECSRPPVTQGSGSHPARLSL